MKYDRKGRCAQKRCDNKNCNMEVRGMTMDRYLKHYERCLNNKG